MSIVANHSELDQRAKQAWEGYRVACADAEPAAYEETELIAWDLLQHELRAVDAERRELETAAAFTDRVA